MSREGALAAEAQACSKVLERVRLAMVAGWRPPLHPQALRWQWCR
jgi:hypothetical protein